MLGLLEGFLPRLPGGVDQGWLPTVEQFDLHYLRGGTQVRSLRLPYMYLLTVLSERGFVLFVAHSAEVIAVCKDEAMVYKACINN